MNSERERNYPNKESILKENISCLVKMNEIRIHDLDLSIISDKTRNL